MKDGGILNGTSVLELGVSNLKNAEILELEEKA